MLNIRLRSHNPFPKVRKIQYNYFKGCLFYNLINFFTNQLFAGLWNDEAFTIFFIDGYWDEYVEKYIYNVPVHHFQCM